LLFPGLFVARGRLLGEGVQAAVDVGVIALVVLDERIDDGQRLLAGGGVVQVDQRFAVDGALQYGKVLPYRFDVKHHALLRGTP
jgi:hypothetical protein